MTLRQEYFENWLAGRVGDSAAWLNPLKFTPEQKVEKLQAGRKPRAVVVEGVEYPSIGAARKATGYSTMKIYYLIDEKHRDTNSRCHRRREIRIGDRVYPSIAKAAVGEKVSTMKIYYMIGEGWRNRLHIKEHRGKK